MEKKILITNRNEKIITCFFEGDKLLTVQTQKKEQSIVGNIYVGRVQQVVPNIHAAFVEIAKGEYCYLSLEEVKEPIVCNRIFDGRLLQGDEVVVQIVRDRIKTKSPTVTTNLSFAGRYAVVTTENKKIGFSGKLTKEQKHLLGEACRTSFSKEFGYVVRTNARELLEESSQISGNGIASLTEEIEGLTAQCEHIRNIAKTRTVFSVLFTPYPEYLLEIRDADLHKIDRIVTDDKAIYETLQKFFAEQKLAEEEKKLSLYEDAGYSLSNLVRLEKHLEEALAKKVWLKCGGYLVIEPTEALTVIDVNSGKYTAKKSMEETFYKINEEAALEIAHQITLRNLSGIIIVDFISMEQKENNSRLLELLKRECKKDSVKTKVVDMTPLGLVEITRQRIYQTLKEQLDS